MTNKSKCKCMIHRWLIYYSQSNYTNNQNNYGLANVPFVWMKCCKIRCKISVFLDNWQSFKTTHDKILWYKKNCACAMSISRKTKVWIGGFVVFYILKSSLYSMCIAFESFVQPRGIKCAAHTWWPINFTFCFHLLIHSYICSSFFHWICLNLTNWWHD